MIGDHRAIVYVKIKVVMCVSSPILKAPLLLGTVEFQAIHHPLVTDMNLKRRQTEGAVDVRVLHLDCQVP